MHIKDVFLLAIAVASNPVFAKAVSTTTTRTTTKTSTKTPVPTPTCTEFDSYADVGYKFTYVLEYVGSKSQYRKVKADQDGYPTITDFVTSDFSLCDALQACTDLSAQGNDEYSYQSFNLLNQTSIWRCVSSYSGYSYTEADDIDFSGTTQAYGFSQYSGCNSHYSGCN